MRFCHPPAALVESMAKPGPKPTPTHLRMVRGDRADRINAKEPKPKKQRVRVPAWLGDDARAVWRRTAKQLDAMGILHACDEDVLVAYVNAVVNYQKATRIVETTGLLVEGRHSGFVVNPAVRVQHQSATLIRQLASELGLTASSRSRLSVEGESAGDESDDLLD